MQVNVAKAFNPGADDPEGPKKAGIFIAIAVLCALTTPFLGLPGIFLMLFLPGFGLAAMRNSATGDNEGKLPSPLALDFLWHGFISILVTIVYSLPVMGICFLALASVAGAASGMVKSSALVSLGSLASLGMLGLAAVLVLLITIFFVPMVLLQYCKRYQFGDCFAIGQIFSDIGRSPLDYAAVVFVPMGLCFALSMIPIAGALVATPLWWLLTASLAGQYGAKCLDMHAKQSKEDSVGFNRFE